MHAECRSGIAGVASQVFIFSMNLATMEPVNQDT